MKFNYKIWCKLFNVLSVRWYIKFYDVFFVFFCYFTAAQSNAMCNFERGDLERTKHLLAMWQDSRWQRIFAQSFLFQIFHICAKKPQDKWVDLTFPKPKGRFFVEIIFSSKYSWKRNRFSIVILNMWDSKWMTYPELSFDVADGHGLKWCIKMDKLFVLIYLSPCFIKLGVVRLCIFCVVMQITWVVWKQTETVPCILHISISEVCRCLCGFREKNVVVITSWCNFRQQRSVLTQFY